MKEQFESHEKVDKNLDDGDGDGNSADVDEDVDITTTEGENGNIINNLDACI